MDGHNVTLSTTADCSEWTLGNGSTTDRMKTPR